MLLSAFVLIIMIVPQMRKKKEQAIHEGGG